MVTKSEGKAKTKVEVQASLFDPLAPEVVVGLRVCDRGEWRQAMPVCRKPHEKYDWPGESQQD